MICSCPKCNAKIEVDLSKIPESGIFTPCPECKSRFWINKESYARMSLNKEGKTYCDQCGKELDHKIVCSACGVMYPDYYLVQVSKPPRRQVEKPDFNISFSLKPARQTYTHTYTYTEAKKTSALSPKSSLQRVGVVALVVLLAVSLGFLYHKIQLDREYAKYFIRALYTIKTGTDLSLNTCAKISTEWKAKKDAGQNYTPHIKEEEESRVNMVKDATDRYMQKLNNPPKKFITAEEKLASLYGVYTRAHTLAVAPSGTLSSFIDSAAKSENDFNVAIKDLKATLPEELSAELQKAKAKYKGLKDI